jgi:hypothetical protein
MRDGHMLVLVVLYFAAVISANFGLARSLYTHDISLPLRPKRLLARA